MPAVADRLLARGVELRDAYGELYEKLHPRPPALKVFLDLLLSTAAFWSPEKIAEARVAREELASVNRQIARKAEELVQLLERRTDLNNTSGFSSETHYHVCDVIEAASTSSSARSSSTTTFPGTRSASNNVSDAAIATGRNST